MMGIIRSILRAVIGQWLAKVFGRLLRRVGNTTMRRIFQAIFFILFGIAPGLRNKPPH